MRQPGILEIIEKETIDTRATPSPVEVKRLWSRLLDDADSIETILARMHAILRILKRWRHLGLVTDDEIQQADDWLKTHARIHSYLLRYRSEGAFLDESFCKGAGI